MKNNIFQICISIVLVFLLFMLTDPFMFWMPDMMTLLVLLLVTVLVAVFSGFIMYEKVVDEREVLHRMYADRTAYLSGIFILTLAVFVQGLNHSIDLWVTVALGLMILVKVFTRFYLDLYK